MPDLLKEIDDLANQYKKMFGEWPASFMLPKDHNALLAILQRAIETKTPIQYPTVPVDVQY